MKLNILTVSSMLLVHDCDFMIEGNGGSQASLLIFEKTASEDGHRVFSMQQHWRKDTQICNHNWQQGKHLPNTTPDLILLMRKCDMRTGRRFRQMFPKARIVCWIQDDNTDTSGLRGRHAPIKRAFIVSKSAASKSMRKMHTPRNKLSVVYNPFRENTTWYNQLKQNTHRKFHIIASGKPVHAVLDKIMRKLEEFDKRFRVHICASKWRSDANNGAVPNAIYHGNLDHISLIRLISSCFIQLNPTMSVETFGYSFAESNALGLPVITNSVKDSTAEEFLNHSELNKVLPTLSVDGFVKQVLNIHNAIIGRGALDPGWHLNSQMDPKNFTRNLILLSGVSARIEPLD